MAVALSLTALTSSSFAQSVDAQTKAAAQKALSTQMGIAGQDLHVTVAGANAELSGWTQSPGNVQQAAYIVSKVAGVDHAYSGAVHTWTTSDHR